jgi:hypothetical protein
MDLRVISKGYFKLTEDEKTVVCEQVLRHFLNEMLISEGNLFELRDIFHKIKETSIERDEYEITEIISQIIEALEELNLEL